MKYNLTIGKLGVLILVGFISTGCSFNIPKYSISAENVISIQNIKSKINIGAFTSKEKNKSSIACRMTGSVGTPTDKPFEQYIKSALISELKLAEKFDPQSKIIINGHLEKIDFNANVFTSNWILELKVVSNNSNYIVVNTKYEFEGSFRVVKRCSEIAQAFVPAVQKLIEDIVNHPGFKQLL